MIPLVHDLSGETVLVIGGGPVGARKARRFDREATVVVLSPDFADADFGDARLVRAAPAAEDVVDWIERTDPALVVAATDDPALNTAAANAARERDALVNRADEAGGRDAGSVVVPATVRDDPVTVAVSTGGTSPALSAALCGRIETEIDGAGALAGLTGQLRDGLAAADVPPAQRREAVRAVVEAPSVWKRLRTSDDKGRDEAMRVVASVLDCTPDEARSILNRGDLS